VPDTLNLDPRFSRVVFYPTRKAQVAGWMDSQSFKYCTGQVKIVKIT
jgi:hypothetical protein